MADTSETQKTTPAPTAPAASDPEIRASGGHADTTVAAHNRTVEAARKAGAAAEAARRQRIDGIFAGFYTGDPLSPITATYESCRDDVACSDLDAQRRLLATLSAQSADPMIDASLYGPQPAAKAPPGASQHLGGMSPQHMRLVRDQTDKRAEGLMLALSIRAGLPVSADEAAKARQGELLSQSLPEMMAYELRRHNYSYAGSREDIVRRYVAAFPILAAGPGTVTDSLPYVLGNIAQKSHPMSTSPEGPLPPLPLDVDQEDPALAAYIRRLVVPPSELPYNLTNPNKTSFLTSSICPLIVSCPSMKTTLYCIALWIIIQQI